MGSCPTQTIFISHANPADNDVARWLAIKLTALGYRVWVDVEKLRGAETIWREIERVMRSEACCLILILSKQSYNRDGLLKEMTLGLTLEKRIERFVLPWIIDDLPFELMPIEIQGRMSVPEVRWSLALPLILAYLDSKGVQPEKRSDPHNYLEKLLIPESCGITQEPATYDLNRIEALALPPFLFGIDAEASTGSGSLVSHNVFQDRRLSLSPLEGPNRLFGRGAPKSYDLAEALSKGLPSMGLGVSDVRRVIVELTSSALEDHFCRRGLVAFSAARKNPVFYFNSETVRSGKVKVRLPENSKTSYRNVWGKHKDIFWHLGMEFSVAVHESLTVTLNPHIVFTKDGLQEPLVQDAELNKKAQQSKRRKVARSWFNDKWRGFFYPFLAHISNDENGIRIDIDDNGPLLFSGALSKIVVPVTHAVVKDLQADDNVFDDEEEFDLV
jgi:hypothetical protein